MFQTNLFVDCNSDRLIICIYVDVYSRIYEVYSYATTTYSFIFHDSK